MYFNSQLDRMSNVDTIFNKQIEQSFQVKSFQVFSNPFSIYVLLFSILVGAKLNTTTPYYVTSPNYPSDYPKHVDCELMITVPSNQIKISFVSFNVEYHNTCK